MVVLLLISLQTNPKTGTRNKNNRTFIVLLQTDLELAIWIWISRFELSRVDVQEEGLACTAFSFEMANLQLPEPLQH